MKLPVAALILLCLFSPPLLAQSPDGGQTQTPPPPDQAEPQKDEVPSRAHTGWKTLLKDSAHDFADFPRRKSTWTLIGIGAAAALATHPADDHVAEHIVGNQDAEDFFMLGKFLGSAQVQIGASVGLWAVGRYVVPPGPNGSRTNKVSEVGFDMMRAQILSQALVQGIKVSVRRDRPTGECCAFPSGHSATAFAVASVLERHFGYRASWPALAAATYVATSRLIDNRHYLSDVMFGAGVGMASGWTVVGTRARARNRLALQPVAVPGGMMIAFVRVE